MMLTIHKSLHRPQQFMGVDRQLCLGSMLLAGIVGLGGFNLLSAACGGLFWIISFVYLKRWAKQDPYLRDVYLRYIRQRNFYPARPSFARVDPVAAWRKR